MYDLDSVHPESLDRGWAGTSPNPLVIGHHPSHGSATCRLQALSLLSLACNKTVREIPKRPQPNGG
jgi:hypothetical protein